MSGTGRYKAFSGYGIELEYMIVDSGTLAVQPISDFVLRDGTGTIQNELEFARTCWSNELVKHVIELKTNGPAPLTAELSGLFHKDLQKINAILAQRGCRIMSTAMHPTFNPQDGVRLWEHDDASIYEAYNRIFDCRGHGWSNLQSMHINLPFYDDSEFGRLHAAVRIVLPVLPALAASSPVFEAKASGLRDCRLDFYRHNQKKIPAIAGHVIPERAWTQAEYRELVYRQINDQIKPHDPDGILEDVWLNSRGAIARFDRNAIEIRVLDIQESPRMDIAIAALVTTLVKSLYDGVWIPYEQQKQLDEVRMKSIFVDALGGGSDTVLTDEAFLGVFGLPAGIRAQELWQRVWQRLEQPYAAQLSPFKAEIEVLLQSGCLANRILRRLGIKPGTAAVPDAALLLKTYRELCDCAEQNRIFVDS
jgi:gamma-glutamyl:cysteine ligase YbdK (ATP-grasp superfamily)